MATTTIRVEEATHRELLQLSADMGFTLMDTVREAAEALRRQRFARQVADELEVLCNDPTAWNDYLAESEEALTDGLD